MSFEKVFERNGIVLYHGDCMELMKDMPTKAFQMAIVDPPYGDGGTGTDFARGGGDSAAGSTSTNHSHAIFGRRKKNIQRSWGTFYGLKKKEQIPWDVAPGPEYFEELFRISERQIVWGGNYFPLPPRRGFVIWDKKIPNEVSFASCEYGWVSWPMNAKIFRRYPPQSHVQRDELCKRFHPTQKPEALYCWLLQMFAKPGDTILDTHAGSCTSLVAAYQMGFPAVGIEIDAGYCEKAVERLEMEMQQGKLF